MAHKSQPQNLLAQFPPNRRAPLRQIFRATWAGLVFLLLSSAFIFAVAVTTDGKPKTRTWVSYASVFIAPGATVLKGSVASLLGVAIYHHLWLRLSDTTGNEHDLTVTGIESLHLASRLSVGMLAEPSAALRWFIGLACFLATSATILARRLESIPSVASKSL
ncbi:hypothetical protein K458DRAFT_388171 [Lentithecium fluviatile CBS 122367]|uniref:Uncharacterized protein n=1 Tax=Lentithecium fluviatile CBS 122367 TaxID=1168545 RepID=A0A6G1J576_9PLEO|nr:hypothetical protein K458DRAFT_388171 [Lentithecium fluviatile CBS 122367]